MHRLHQVGWGYYLLQGRKALKRFRLDIRRIIHLEITVYLSQMELIDGSMALLSLKKSGWSQCYQGHRFTSCWRRLKSVWPGGEKANRVNIYLATGFESAFFWTHVFCPSCLKSDLAGRVWPLLQEMPPYLWDQVFPSSVKKGLFWFLILWQGISHQRTMCQIIVAIKATCPTFFCELCSNSFDVLVTQLLRRVSSMTYLQVSV